MRTLLALLFLSTVGRAVAQQPGDLDLSFDGDGIVVFDGFSGVGSARLLALPDLTLLVAFPDVEDGAPVIRMVRISEDGSIETSYGINGILTVTSVATLTDIQLQPDGKVLLIGRNVGGVVPEGYDLVVERYTMDGQLDPTYGVDGRCTLEFTEATLSIIDAAVSPDFDLYIGARRGGSFFICRISGAGELDPSFGTDGFRMDLPSIQQIGLLSFGMIQFTNDVSGVSTPYRIPLNGQGAIWQYSNNAPSNDISHYGVMAINIYDRSIAKNLRYIPMLPGAQSDYGVSIFQYNPHLVSGGPNIGYSGNFAMFAAGWGNGPNGDVRCVGADQIGNFFVASRRSTEEGWRLNRIPIVGFINSFDPNFGVAGNVQTVFDPGTQAYVTKIRAQVDGKLVLAGTATVNGVNRIVLARYHNIPDPRAKLSVRMFLGGCYEPALGLMRDDLRQQDLVPALQPYGPPFYQPGNGLGPWAIPQHALEVEGEEAVVDWVWLELINATDSSNVMATRVGLLHRNGMVTSSDGLSPIDFGAGAGTYFLRVRHRNHLSATISQPLTLSSALTEVDLSDPATPTFGTDAQMVITGGVPNGSPVQMLWPGDATTDAAVKYVGSYNDRDRILQAIGGAPATATITGYHAEDLNMDGIVKYVGTDNDRDIILQTIGGVEVTAVRLAQQP